MAAFAKSWRREVVVEGGDRGGSNQHRATEAGATSIVPPLNRRTARSRRVIVPFTHLAREGRMTVTIGRRELLAAAAWPISARAASEQMRQLFVLMGGRGISRVCCRKTSRLEDERSRGNWP